MSAEQRLRAVLPRGARRALVRLGRLRWLRKAALVRSYGVRVRDRPLTVARFVLSDPETDNFSYELANEDELAGFAAAALGIARDRAASLISELERDAQLAEELRRRVRWRLDHKRRVLFGRRAAWYAIVRELKPALVVETGIKDGLGSTALLSALERNAAEGAPGRLASFDLYPDNGWIVPERLRARWQTVFADTRSALETALEGEEIGMLIHDSDPSYDTARFEYEHALANAAPRLALVAGTAHWSRALRDLCAEHGVAYHHFQDRPRDHVHPGSSTGVGIFRRA